jgi:hypothetical protein
MFGRMHVAVTVVVVAVAVPAPAFAWDYPGHRIVGAIADLVLQKHDPEVYKKVQALLATRDKDGKEVARTLSEVAVFPDCAKKGNEPYCRRPPSDEEKAYAARNPHNATYHYTDVPIEQRRYVAGTAGTADTDVVQMIGYAVAQLRRKTPPKKKDVDLTDAEALWLLAHLVGDIHQPLHVGAKFYDKSCSKGVDPNREGDPPSYGLGKTIAETVGGNLISLTAPGPAVPPAENLHFFWDGAAVVQAMQAAGVANSEPDFAKLLAGAAPAGWKSKGDADGWATLWATEMIPLARDAHARLAIKKRVKPAPVGATLNCAWETTLDKSYQDWAREQARIQLAKAGFRLAALLKAIFEP